LAIASDERMAELVDSDKADLRKLSDLQQQAAGYAKRGATRQALECIGQARTIAERLFGPLAILPLRLQLASGQSNEQLGRWDEAKQDFAQVAERARKMFASPHPDLEAALFHGGIIERQLGNLDRAIELLTQSKEMTEKLYGRHAAFAARSNDLAVALHRGGRNEEALRELALAEDLRRSQLGGQHPLVAECLLNQGAVLIDQQNWKAARDKLQAAENICDANSGAVALGHEVRQQLATLDVIEKDFASAARRLTKALETEAKQSNRYSPQYASLAYRLALSLAFQRDFKQAEPLLRHALSVQRNLLGPSHDQTQKTLQALAQLLERTERAAEAKTLREQNSYTVAQDPGETSQ
jgi:tetratricopeptide (TPR) repeat protein